MIRSLWLGNLEPVPADPSNRHANDPRAAGLGRRIFFDTRFSANNQVACATCHQPEKYFTDGLPVSRGIADTRRGAPSLIGTAYSDWLYWDGRRDSHWAQALVPVETPAEHGIDRHRLLRELAADASYRAGYEALFGALPADSSDQLSIDRAFSNVGKALAAFERTLLPTPSRFDAYVDAIVSGEADAVLADARLTADELAGLKLFIDPDRVQCTRCHNGPMFTNFGFHNIGLIQLKRGVRKYDFGRARATRQVLEDPFNCLGAFSDAGEDECEELTYIRTWGPELPGAFKVPTLRNVAETAPYMHDGRFGTLHEVLAHYKEAPLKRLGHQELNPLDLTQRQIDQLVQFLRILTGAAPARP
ncbi:MAG: cytochrome-c peroxidase [Gammaproteobacteria bacterium]